MTHVMNREEMLAQELEHLRDEHQDLNEAIAALQSESRANQLSITRLKKRKLALKDRIQRIEDEITPDIIA